MAPTAPAWAKVTKLLAISYFLHPIKNLSKNPDKLKGIVDSICKCSTNTLSAFLSQLLGIESAVCFYDNHLAIGLSVLRIIGF